MNRKHQSHKNVIWMLLALFVLPILLFCVWYGRQVRQKHLDYALIESIKKNDTQKALALLDDGADANAEDKPYTSLTFKSILADFWYRFKGKLSQQDRKQYPTALLLPYSWDEGSISLPYYPHKYHLRRPSDNPTLVKALLEHGANPYATDELGQTILHRACNNDHTNTVKVLLEHRVNPNVGDKNGFTPLMDLGEERASTDICALLISHGANVNPHPKNSSTILMYPMNLKTLQLLLDQKVDINATDCDGETTLIHWCKIPSISSVRVKLFLKYGANVSQKDKRGKTALDYAKENKEKTVIPLLEAALKRAQTEQNTARKDTK